MDLVKAGGYVFLPLRGEKDVYEGFFWVFAKIEGKHFGGPILGPEVSTRRPC